MKWDRHLGSADVHVKFQSLWGSLNQNIAASGLNEILYQDVKTLVNRDPADPIVNLPEHKSHINKQTFMSYVWGHCTSAFSVSRLAAVLLNAITDAPHFTSSFTMHRPIPAIQMFCGTYGEEIHVTPGGVIISKEGQTIINILM